MSNKTAIQRKQIKSFGVVTTLNNHKQRKQLVPDSKDSNKLKACFAVTEVILRQISYQSKMLFQQLATWKIPSCCKNFFSCCSKKNLQNMHSVQYSTFMKTSYSAIWFISVETNFVTRFKTVWTSTVTLSI